MADEHYVIPSRNKWKASVKHLRTNEGFLIPLDDYEGCQEIIRRAWGLPEKRKLDQEQKKAVKEANDELYFLKHG